MTPVPHQPDHPTPLRLLHVEDSESDAALVQRALTRGGFALTAHRVETADDMRAALRDASWDAVIADYQLPAFTATAALQVLHETTLDLPFIVVSGTIGEDIAVAVMRAGAHDYVMKDRLERLAPAVRREIAEAARRRVGVVAQDALQQMEAQYRTAIEASSDGFLLLAADGRILHVNAAFQRQSGFPAADLQAMRLGDLAAGVEAADLATRIDAAARAGTGRLETRLRARHGTPWDVELSVSPMPDGTGRVCVFARDVTEQKRAAREFRRFVAASPAVIYALRATERGLDLVWASDNLEALTGFHPQDTDTDWWRRRLHPDDAPRVLAAHPTPYTTPHQVLEFRFRCRDGRYIWVRDEKRLMPDTDGRGVEVVGSWIDITSRIDLEDQYRQAQKMEAIGRLAGGVAHDFNNVLTVIQGYGGALLDDGLDAEEIKDSATQICLAADRAAALTRQLLAFSRKQTLQTTVVDVPQLVTGVERLLGRLIGEDIRLRTDLSPDTPRVKADAGHMEQVLINLAVNARDAMPDGGTLTIGTGRVVVGSEAAHADRPAGAYARIVVTDTGRGMTPDVRARVFEPFFTTKEVGRGTGLGLAMVFGVVKQLGGHVEVWSEPGEGARFTIDLPAAEPAATAIERAAASAPDARGTETVLVIEDEEPVRNIARLALEARGYRVLAAADGAQALMQADRMPIDLVLTDVVMPGMSGREVATRLLERHPAMKVLYMSGYFDDALVRAQLAEAQASVLPKPFTPRSLAEKVRRVLDDTPA